MLFSGITESPTRENVSTDVLRGLVADRRKTKGLLRAIPPTMTAAAIKTNWYFFALALLRLSFSGRFGLPTSALYRLKRWIRTPCFTLHSPSSCSCGYHCL